MTHRSAPVPGRRQLLRHALSAALAAPALALPARAWAAPARELAFDHLHTRERIDIVYARGNDYLPEALGRLDHFLRDHHSGEVGHIDPGLHDLLHTLRRALGTDRPYQVISGYRSPHTNARLQATRGGGVATRSLHMQGQAIDVRVSGVPLAELRDAAWSLQAGGVGYYPHEQFVHLDVGRVRRWG